MAPADLPLPPTAAHGALLSAFRNKMGMTEKKTPAECSMIPYSNSECSGRGAPFSFLPLQAFPCSVLTVSQSNGLCGTLALSASSHGNADLCCRGAEGSEMGEGRP